MYFDSGLSPGGVMEIRLNKVNTSTDWIWATAIE